MIGYRIFPSFGGVPNGRGGFQNKVAQKIRFQLSENMGQLKMKTANGKQVKK